MGGHNGLRELLADNPGCVKNGGKDRFCSSGQCPSDERERLLRELVADLSLNEKIDQMSACTSLFWHALMLPRYNLRPYESGKNNSHGIPPVEFCDGPRGIALNHSTCFPVSMARGATWDPGLESRVGDAMGYEARAQGGNFYGGVCINLLRHPGWGRARRLTEKTPITSAQWEWVL